METCEVCGLTVNLRVRRHPCRFERGCSCWRGVACHVKQETSEGSGNFIWLLAEQPRSPFARRALAGELPPKVLA